MSEKTEKKESKETKEKGKEKEDEYVTDDERRKYKKTKQKQDSAYNEHRVRGRERLLKYIARRGACVYR